MELPLMSARRTALYKVAEKLDSHRLRASIDALFHKKKTIHADLELRWLKPVFQEQHIGPQSQYQVVIAKIKPGQKSRAHLHEAGSSSFQVLPLGAYSGNSPWIPRDLVFRTSSLPLHLYEKPLKRMRKKEVRCKLRETYEIPAYTVHQFENRGKRPAYILIVTHPIISVESGHEDICFVKSF